MKVALIDYDMGNLLSVSKALEAADCECEIISRANELPKFDCALLPGVGNFGDGGENLQKRGFYGAIREFAGNGKKLLGICLGMQLLLDSSEEAPGVPGLGIIKGEVKRFPISMEKVPHIGWNRIEWRDNENFEDGYFYFVHSYYARPAMPEHKKANCRYILDFAAAVGEGSTLGVQFHPEKSQGAGLALLRRFFHDQTGKTQTHP